jgi:hypothetical protein
MARLGGRGHQRGPGHDDQQIADPGERAAGEQRLVLMPGGSRPAAKLIEDFLGRPFDSRAWERWLQSEEQTSSRVND